MLGLCRGLCPFFGLIDTSTSNRLERLFRNDVWCVDRTLEPAHSLTDSQCVPERAVCCVVFRGSIGVSYVIPVMNDASFQVSDLASAINNSASRTRCSGGCCTAPAPRPGLCEIYHVLRLLLLLCMMWKWPWTVDPVEIMARKIRCRLRSHLAVGTSLRFRLISSSVSILYLVLYFEHLQSVTVVVNNTTSCMHVLSGLKNYSTWLYAPCKTAEARQFWYSVLSCRAFLNANVPETVRRER